MNAIEKLLKKLDIKTRGQIEQILLQLANNQLADLAIKKVKGTKDIYRIRVGKYRIIFRASGQNINLITVTRRDEKTYKDY